MNKTIACIVTAGALTACAADLPAEDTDEVEDGLSFVRVPVAPPKLVTTLDTWRERCGEGMDPVGVIVPRDAWSCPSVQDGNGAFVGLDGRDYVAQGHALGLDDATLLSYSPDLTPAMVAGQQPFCAYSYVTGNGSPSIRLAASRFASLESSVGSIAGPLCFVHAYPAPGSTSCPSCWSYFLAKPIMIYY